MVNVHIDYVVLFIRIGHTQARLGSYIAPKYDADTAKAYFMNLYSNYLPNYGYSNDSVYENGISAVIAE